MFQHGNRFPLAPMGILAPRSAHARPSDRPPIDTSVKFSGTRVCRVAFKHLPQPSSRRGRQQAGTAHTSLSSHQCHSPSSKACSHTSVCRLQGWQDPQLQDFPTSLRKYFSHEILIFLLFGSPYKF